MQAGILSGADVREFTSRVVVAGVEREHFSWSVDRDLVGEMPAQVVAASGIQQATGTIVWAEGPDVATTTPNPWNEASGWLPSKGDPVVIYSSDGVTEWVQFTGVIDENRGSVGGSSQSAIVDASDRLSTPFSHEPLMRIMSPRARGGVDYRAVGLTHLYYADQTLRSAGFFATPPMENRTILSVPAQSSMWPEAGVMTSGLLGGPDGGPWCQAYDAPDGVSIADVQNGYAPALVFPMSDTVRYSMTVSPDHGGNTTMNAYYGATDYVQLAVAGSRTVIARLNGVEVCRVVMGSAVRVSLLLKGGVWTLRTNTGVTASGTATPPTTANLDRVTITADAASRVAGFHAVRTSDSTDNLYTEFVPTARYHMESLLHLGLMDAGPTLEPTTARDVLERISKATLTAMWIDELGTFHWAPSVNLRAQDPVQTITTLDDIQSLAWSDSLLGVRSRVETSWDMPGISRSRWDNVLWYQGNTETLESGQVKTEFIDPGPNTDWVGLSEDYLILGAPGASAPSNSGWGSVTGAVLADSTTEGGGASYLTSALEKINVSTYKLVHSAGALPEGKKLELRYPTTSSTIWPRWHKEPFPLIRGFGKTEWVKQSYMSTVAGPAYAPVLRHDVGPWVSRDGSGAADNTVLIRIADYLATQVSAPAPTITGMQVGYDPRRQLGDVITVSSSKLMGITLTALVVGIRSGASDSGYGQSLAVRIISATRPFTTYAEFEKAHSNTLTYEQWRLLFPNTATYSTFNNDPLRGA